MFRFAITTEITDSRLQILLVDELARSIVDLEPMVRIAATRAASYRPGDPAISLQVLDPGRPDRALVAAELSTDAAHQLRHGLSRGARAGRAASLARAREAGFPQVPPASADETQALADGAPAVTRLVDGDRPVELHRDGSFAFRLRVGDQEAYLCAITCDHEWRLLDQALFDATRILLR